MPFILRQIDCGLTKCEKCCKKIRREPPEGIPSPVTVHYCVEYDHLVLDDERLERCLKDEVEK